MARIAGSALRLNGSVRWPIPRRALQTTSTTKQPNRRNSAFVFDIDGVLARSSKALPGAHQALSKLQTQGVQFALVTNGGGRHESDRAAALTRELCVEIDQKQIIQSHTPFADLRHLHDEPVLVVGGDRDSCRQVAIRYGFRKVVTTADIVADCPAIWPYSDAFAPYHRSFARPLTNRHPTKIRAVLVFNDPRDWALDASIILDLLLSSRGELGTLSALNGNRSLPNNGYGQDGQPELYFSNPDLWWSSAYHLPRLGQGGFRHALEGVWNAATGGDSAVLRQVVMGKPHRATFEFAERRLLENAKTSQRLDRVYMIGDNPESDIKGGNDFVSPAGLVWKTVLVRTGVWRSGQPDASPTMIRDNVLDAVEWALADVEQR